jgi:hypothetical protein
MTQIYDMGTPALLPLRRKACWGFFRPEKSEASAGFEPANLGTRGQHASSRLPKPLREGNEKRKERKKKKNNSDTIVCFTAGIRMGDILDRI